MQALPTCTHTQHCHTTPLSEQVTLQPLHSHSFEIDCEIEIRPPREFGHPSPRAKCTQGFKLGVLKEKRLSSLSQLQMVIAAVVLKGEYQSQAAKLTLIWLKVMKSATPYIVAVESFAMSVCVTAKHRPPLLTAAGQGLSVLQWHGS